MIKQTSLMYFDKHFKEQLVNYFVQLLVTLQGLGYLNLVRDPYNNLGTYFIVNFY